ncbi:hypothetical protein Pan181_37920 [Aeoliella mucimassa]|uniref:Uncharacterized protein n=1 Tax=Aeoliella mucimassa TaxID=2527972 RepID=A0A518AS78_9BACT|nr:hypothetical protein Pan181_37920 [Aeoliella mucimassa]
MQLTTGKRLAISAQRENRFPLDAFWEVGIYSSAKTTGFIERAKIQFSHRWVNWESIPPLWESILPRRGAWLQNWTPTGEQLAPMNTHRRLVICRLLRCLADGATKALRTTRLA